MFSEKPKTVPKAIIVKKKKPSHSGSKSDGSDTATLTDSTTSAKKKKKKTVEHKKIPTRPKTPNRLDSNVGTSVKPISDKPTMRQTANAYSQTDDGKTKTQIDNLRKFLVRDAIALGAEVSAPQVNGEDESEYNKRINKKIEEAKKIFLNRDISTSAMCGFLTVSEGGPNTTELQKKHIYPKNLITIGRAIAHETNEQVAEAFKAFVRKLDFYSNESFITSIEQVARAEKQTFNALIKALEGSEFKNEIYKSLIDPTLLEQINQADDEDDATADEEAQEQEQQQQQQEQQIVLQQQQQDQDQQQQLPPNVTEVGSSVPADSNVKPPTIETSTEPLDADTVQQQPLQVLTQAVQKAVTQNASLPIISSSNDNALITYVEPNELLKLKKPEEYKNVEDFRKELVDVIKQAYQKQIQEQYKEQQYRASQALTVARPTFSSIYRIDDRHPRRDDTQRSRIDDERVSLIPIGYRINPLVFLHSS